MKVFELIASLFVLGMYIVGTSVAMVGKVYLAAVCFLLCGMLATVWVVQSLRAFKI